MNIVSAFSLITKSMISSLNLPKYTLFSNGFVNFGPMANPKYNDLVPEQQALIEMFREEDELVNFILENLA